MKKGTKHSEKTKRKIRKNTKIAINRPEIRKKCYHFKKGERVKNWNGWKKGERSSPKTEWKKGQKPWNFEKVGVYSKKTLRKMKIARQRQKMGKGENSSISIGYKNILKEIPKLEKQGFRCIPIGKVIPDIIAIKENEIYAIEIERNKPDYKKYDKDDYRKYFKDIIWIIKKK